MLKAGTVVLTLLAAGPLQAAALSSLPPLTDDSVRNLLSNYLRTWSSNENFNAATMGRFYADRVIYYGKPMSRSKVLEDKKRYIAAWPERRYAVVPGSHAVVCDAGKTACIVSGLMEWDRRGAKGQRSIGSARLRLVVTAESGGRIARETATIGR